MDREQALQEYLQRKLQKYQSRSFVNFNASKLSQHCNIAFVRHPHRPSFLIQLHTPATTRNQTLQELGFRTDGRWWYCIVDDHLAARVGASALDALFGGLHQVDVCCHNDERELFLFFFFTSAVVVSYFLHYLLFQ